MSESHFNRITRRGIEKNITEAFEAGDSSLMNYHLDLYPYGKRRPDISLEQATSVSSLGDMSLQDTIEFEPLRGV